MRHLQGPSPLAKRSPLGHQHRGAGCDTEQLRVLRRGQAGAHTLLFPGGYSDCKQDPTPFINFAHANPEVLAVVPFLWCSVPWESFKGIRDVPEVKDKYVAAGLSIVNKGA